VIQSSKLTIEKAIKIGGLLQAQKDELEHGQWGPWVKTNLKGISRATVTNYLLLYKKRAELKLLNVRNLAEAYRLLYGNPEKPNGKSKGKSKDKKGKKDDDDKDAGPPPDVVEYTLLVPRKIETDFVALLDFLTVDVFHKDGSKHDEFHTVYQALWFVNKHRDLVTSANEEVVNA
jgi:hypothetical protein